MTLNEDHCVSLKDILVSFNAPISEEHGWAICYQSAKCFRNALLSDRPKCRVVSQLDQVLIDENGHVHTNSIFAGDGGEDNGQGGPSEHSVVVGLGYTLYRALDYGMEADEDRHLSPELERVIGHMASAAGEDRLLKETDDECIERGSGDSFEDSNQHPLSLSRVLQLCTVHLGCEETQEADQHYEAVFKALVTEAIKQGHAKLSPIKRNKLSESNESLFSNKGQVTRNSRRLIKVDYSHIAADGLDEDKSDDVTDDGEDEEVGEESKNNPRQRTAYDLATQCPSRCASMRTHTVVVYSKTNGINFV